MRRARKLHRVELVTDIKSRFVPNIPLTVHWDGKLLPDITSREMVDRLPVLVSGADVQQLLGIPRIAAGYRRDAQKTAILQCLDDWNLRSKTKCLCFDTA